MIKTVERSTFKVLLKNEKNNTNVSTVGFNTAWQQIIIIIVVNFYIYQIH